jgi:hypothetical protein
MYRDDDNERGAGDRLPDGIFWSQALLRRVLTYKIDLILLLAAAASRASSSQK